MNRTTLTAIAATILACTGVTWAQSPQPAPQPDYSKVDITTTDLGHNTYMLAGQGGNITVAVGGDGVIMVDSEFAPLHDKIKAAIAAVTQEPIRYLVNTHFHGDHTGGDAGFAMDGATVVAQTNVRTRLAEGSINSLTGVRTPPVTGEALPTKTYSDKLTLRVKGLSAQLMHFANAHTDGDTYIYFKDANVLSTGDIVSVGARYPNIDVLSGGNVKGMIAGVDEFLKLSNNDTKIVPGHGPLLNKAALQDYRAVLVTARDRVITLIKDGKSIDEAVAAKPLVDLDAKVGATQMGSDNFVRLVYRSLKPA